MPPILRGPGVWWEQVCFGGLIEVRIQTSYVTGAEHLTFPSFSFHLGKRGKYFFLRVEFKSENIYKMPHTKKFLTNASFTPSPSNGKVEKHKLPRDSTPTSFWDAVTVWPNFLVTCSASDFQSPRMMSLLVELSLSHALMIFEYAISPLPLTRGNFDRGIQFYFHLHLGISI